MPTEGRSALVIVVPEAEPLVGPFRNEYTKSGPSGMPSHVTALYPFKPVEEIDESVMMGLSETAASVSAFNFTLEQIERFPSVLYLSPEPSEPFREVTRALARRFPENPPYNGAFPDPVPHLTIASPSKGRELDAIEEAFVSKGGLPIRATADAVQLYVVRDNRWTPSASFPLA